MMIGDPQASVALMVKAAHGAASFYLQNKGSEAKNADAFADFSVHLQISFTCERITFSSQISFNFTFPIHAAEPNPG